MAEIPDEPFDLNEPGALSDDAPAPPPPTSVPSLDTLTSDEKTLLLRDLKEAYYSGALRVRFRERDVIYRKLSEMRLIIADLEASLAPRRRPQAAVFATFGRGY